MKKLIVFDFDKTLSYDDSLMELFYSEMRGWKYFLRPYYIYLKVLSRFGLSSAKKEKEKMICLLFHSEEARFKAACERQAASFKLSPIIEILRHHIEKNDKVIILSASSIYFLNRVFKDMNVEIIGTTLFCANGKILNIARHPFYKEKLACLKNAGVEYIDDFYFDSKWDECLMPICKRWHRVKNGIIIEEG